MFSIIAGITIVGVITFIIIRQCYKKTYYMFDKNGLRKMKNDVQQFSINWSQTYDIFYVRIIWMFLFQFGAGHLIIKYMNENKEEYHTIALSKRQIKQISETFKKNIQIK